MKLTKVGKPALWRTLSVCCAAVLTVGACGLSIVNDNAMAINGALGMIDSKIVEVPGGENVDSMYYKSAFKTQKEMHDHNREVARRIEAEGAVLLKNENNALPLAKGAKVSLFSRSSTDVVTSGTGSGALGGNLAPTMKEAFEKDNKMSVNPTLWQAYIDYTAKLDKKNRAEKAVDMETFVASAEYRLLEAPESVYTTDVKNSYKNFKDAAIVTITRVAGEGSNDAPTGDFADGTKYLALQESEKAMLKEIKANFDKIIVLVNSSNAMELDWADTQEYGIDSVLWIGGVGQEGLWAVADILVGNVNPSGRTVDTYAVDSFSSAAMQNFASNTYTNADALDAALAKDYGAKREHTYNKYRVYQEGIYVGYKYYETRYEDSILGKGNATGSAGVFASKNDTWNYAEEVTYPFGYGLSYSTFRQSIKNVKESDDSFEITVHVENLSDVKGKSVVQIYAQQPYTDFDRQNGIEKSAIQLVGFGKTKEIDKKGTDDVVIKVDKYDMATYDSKVNKGYILEAGDYYLSLGDDSHDALNNVLAAKEQSGMYDAKGQTVTGNADKTHKWTLGKTDNEKFAYSQYTKGKVTNRFEDADLNYYGKDLVKYVTRNDWNSFPKRYDTLTANAQMIEALKFKYKPSNDTDTSKFKVEQKKTLNLASMVGVDFNDSHWDELLDQMSLDELMTVVARACKAAVVSIDKPLNYLKDGTQTIAGNASSGGGLYYEKPVGEAMLEDDKPTDVNTVAYPAEVVLACSYNADLARELGEAFGEDGLWSLVHHHYAPGANIHRTPYSGRNYEYYSEDAYLTAIMASEEVAGQKSKGLIPYIKHFAMNDQEERRLAIAIFCEEQAMREIYFRGFEYAIAKSKVPAIMGSYSRIGLTWTGAYKPMMTDMLVGEWGFNGILDTDASLFSFMEAKSAVMAGTTDFAGTDNSRSNELMTNIETDAQLYAKVRDAAKRNLYVIANSAEMNGRTSNTRIVKILTPLQIGIISAICVLGVAFAATTAMYVLQVYFNKKEESENE